MFCKVFHPCLGLCPKEVSFRCSWKLRQQCLPEMAGSRTFVDKSRWWLRVDPKRSPVCHQADFFIHQTRMDDDEDEQRRSKRRRTDEFRETKKLLQTLDYQDHRDLASHLLIAAQHQKKQPQSRKAPRLQLMLENGWTAWPLPSSMLPRPDPIPSSSDSEQHDRAPNPLHAEIEAALLRLARTQIQKDGNPLSVSANEHPPYHITREVRDSVISKVDYLLQALGRVKFGQITSERARQRAPKTTWEDIVGMAGLQGWAESQDTMERISERCKKLFEEEKFR